ncbi:MAG: hypothetical protein NZL93_05925, partial [Chthoniobacterales bacterium]|nr:hypothetical protein [Chthoniobacterales bacterium]
MQWRFFINNSPIEEPIGWDDISLQLVRDEKWHGVFPEYSLNELKFICRGYEIIKNAFELYGPDMLLDFLVQYRCTEHEAWTNFFTGSITSEGLSFNPMNNVVSTGISPEKGIVFLKNRADTQVLLTSLVTIPTSANPNGISVLTQPETDTSLPNYGYHPIKVTSNSFQQQT